MRPNHPEGGEAPMECNLDLNTVDIMLKKGINHINLIFIYCCSVGRADQEEWGSAMDRSFVVVHLDV